MSRPNKHYATSLQGRFLSFMKKGWEPFDDALMENEDRRPDCDLTAEEKQKIKDEATQREKIFINRLDALIYTKGKRWATTLYAILSVFICLALIFVLMQTVSALPLRGDPNAPTNNEVSRRYIEKGLEETGAVNIVAGMILDYRAFDTLGESTVLFIAACAVLILLRIDHNDDGTPSDERIAAEADDRRWEPKNDRILQGSALLLTPLVLLLGIYVILNGHLSPGGGFSGGSIISAGLILYLNAFGFQKASRFFTYKTFTAVSLVALLFYGLAKTYSFFMGANHLESGIPLGTPGALLSSGLILPLNICVGMVVACTMYVFYCLFRKGGI